VTHSGPFPAGSPAAAALAAAENGLYVAYAPANGSDMTLDSRPSDAIALAIRAKVPIPVEDRVFDKSRSSEPRSGPSPHF